MKICFIAPKAYQLFNQSIESTFGGAEVQLRLIAKELAQNKSLDIQFIVADYSQNDLEDYEGIKVWKSLNFKENIIKQILKFLKIFKKNNADVYIQRTLTPFSGIMALYCRLTGKKFVYMVAHDSETDGIHIVFKTKIKSFFANLVFKYSDLIITQNEYQKRTFKRKNIESVIIKSGYLIPEYIGNKKDYILWVGRSEDWKRPGLFLKLAEHNTKENFVMVCPPSTYNPDLSNELKEKARKIKNIEFVEFVPFNRIDNYFQEAKIFVNTSTQEGFPNTFIQAAKNKTPIISMNVNPDNFLNEYNCGFCCNNNFDEMNKKLNKLMKDKGLYQVMSENAYKYARENHDIKKTAKKFYELIKGLK